MRFAKVISSEIENNQVILQVEAIDGEMEVIYCNANNSFTLPPKNTVILLQETTQKNKFISHSSQNDFSHFKDLEDGELCMYAIDNNEVKSNIKFKKEGNKIIINDGDDFLVSWNNLNDKLQQIENAIKELYTTLNTHQHLVNLTGSGTPPVVSGFSSQIIPKLKIPTIADSSTFKIDNIQVNQPT